MGLFASLFSSEVIHDKDLFPSLPPCESIVRYSKKKSAVENERNITLSFDRISNVPSNFYQNLIEDKSRPQHLIHKSIKYCDESQSLHEDRNKSPAIACPLSRSMELTPNSDVTRFQERRYEQATWQMYYRIQKARVKRGAYQSFEKPVSFTYENKNKEQSMGSHGHSLLDMEVFDFEY